MPRQTTDMLQLTATILAATTDGARRFTARLYTVGEFTRDYRKMAFAPGALDDFDDDIPVAYAHQTGGGFFGGAPIIIGKVLKVWENQRAAFAEMELSTTPDADTVWTLISDGSLTKVSIGGRITRFEFNEETEELTVLAFDLMEISVVPVPAMRSAQITKHHQPELVQLTTQGAAMPPETTTLTPEPAATAPTPDATTEPAAAPAAPSNVEDRLATIEDLMRTRLAPDIPATTGAARPRRFRSIGELLGSVAAMDLGKDADARDRLAHGLESGAVTFNPNGTRMVDVFAFEVGDSDDATGDGGQVNDLLRLLRDGRVTSEYFAKGDLDTVPGKTVDAPTIAQGVVVDYQTEAGAVASQKQVWDEDSFPKATLAGGQTITVQARDWSRPSYMDEVISDLVSAYGEKVNLEVVAGAGDTGPPATLEGILTVQTNREDATNAVPGIGLILALATAKANVYTATKRWPQHCFAAGSTWGTIESLSDSEGRPLLALEGPNNPIGVMDGPSPVGRIRGLVGHADDAVTDGLIIVGSFRDAKLWESKSAPVRIGLTYPDSLTIDVAVFGYLAIAIRRAGAFDVVENVGATA